jgi:hypothetical protein
VFHSSQAGDIPTPGFCGQRIVANQFASQQIGVFTPHLGNVAPSSVTETPPVYVPKEQPSGKTLSKVPTTVRDFKAQLGKNLGKKRM